MLINLHVKNLALIEEEDIDFEDSAISQRERLDHINTVLDSANLNIYRRHIAPKV